jgi:hypothetical protein
MLAVGRGFEIDCYQLIPRVKDDKYNACETTSITISDRKLLSSGLLRVTVASLVNFLKAGQVVRTS